MSTQPSERYSLHVEWSEEDDAFVAMCPAFPALSAFGDTRAQALYEAETALELFIEEYEESGDALPDPRELAQYSGQTRIRMPRSLHAELSREADRQDVSLNTLMVSYLQRGLGYETGAREERQELVREMRKELFEEVSRHLRPLNIDATGDSAVDYDPLDEQQQRLRR